ncbi:pentatricopeptide repeat-containing protein DOT4, chloroplastic isoform X2 [Zingiber officinale]|uniref:pentatricopeptide repeat-containing protein DOT4, chloroplastic isoform X2 n=1 Tax=Zingiber officinale TaxID=94328 RepID=UPI001C4CEF9D|nr:pentatricopeptide repeat-containing protein DOT4, chloroplastic isoform X2 [Zingiber officinale]
MAVVALPLSPNSGLHLSSHNPWTQRNRSLSCFSLRSKSRIRRVHSLSLRTNGGGPIFMSEDTNISPREEILRLCLTGNLSKALSLICESESSNLDSQVYCSVLQLCAKLGALEDGMKLHSIISSSGLQIDNVLGSKLMFMYVKCGDLSQGRNVFDELASKEALPLWNSMLTAYSKSGNHKEVISLFKKMRHVGVVPDSSTSSCVLKCLGFLGLVTEGKWVHGYLVKLGLDRYNAVGNALVAFYSKCHKIDDAIKLFEEMPDKDIISWNSIISGCVSNGLPGISITLFNELVSLGLHFDLATLAGVLSACAETACLGVGRTIHGYAIKVGFVEDITIQNSLINMYSKCWNLVGAVQVFEKMNEKSVVSWTSMISAYAQAGQLEEAFSCFRQMESVGIKPDQIVIVAILHACACNQSLEEGKYIHSYIVRNKSEKNIFVSNALMNMYAKCGNMLEAKKVFDEMDRKDIVSWNTLIGGYSKIGMANEALNLFCEMQSSLRPNSVTMSCILPAVASLSSLDKGIQIHAQILRISKKDRITWTVMIAGYGMHGHGNTAITLFKKMRYEGIEPDEVSFSAILYACSHSGLLNEGWKFFDMMRNECKIVPNLEHYTCMVDLLSRAGHLTKAYKFIESMPIQPDSTIWSTLLSGCRIHRDVKLAETVAEKVIELEPDNTRHYILLANTYADVERWKAMKKLRKSVGTCGLQKNLNCSWIEIKNKVHIFVSSDRSHPKLRKIELFLEEVSRQMETDGSVSKMKYALLSVDCATREEALCGHSEKLAIAFGILNCSKGKPVRVTKNSRVCIGCHNVAKFISKMSKREILLRDSNRFHHFVQGRCSCRGYW